MNYIITWSDANFIPIFKGFIVSLFTLGKFQGKLIYYYYYEKDEDENIEFTELISNTFDVKVIRKQKEHHMNQTIYVGLKDLIFSNFFNSKDKIAIYDADFWFQDDMNPLFDLTPKRFAVSCELNDEARFKQEGSNMSWYYSRPHIQEYFKDFPEKEKVEVINQLDDLAKKYNMINSGFMLGKYNHIKIYIKWINEYYENYPFLLYRFSPDQFLLNYYLRSNLDDMRNYLYNYCIFCTHHWTIKDNKIVTIENETPKAIHLQRFKDEEFYDHSFLKYYPEYKEIYSEIFKEE